MLIHDSGKGGDNARYRLPVKYSTATVSRALKNDSAVSSKTKERIFAVAEEMNYRTNHFASNLRNPRSATIGVIVPRLNSNFMSSVIAGIESIVSSEGTILS